MLFTGKAARQTRYYTVARRSLLLHPNESKEAASHSTPPNRAKRPRSSFEGKHGRLIDTKRRCSDGVDHTECRLRKRGKGFRHEYESADGQRAVFRYGDLCR